MNTSLYRILLLTITLCLSGCFPGERIWWSPAGDRAVVLVDDKLHLATADGELGPALLGGASMEREPVQTLSWLRDGSGFVFHRMHHLPTWEETQKLIPKEEAAAVDSMMPAVLPLLESAIHLADDVESIDALIAALGTDRHKPFRVALYRTRLTDPAPVEKVLLKHPKGAEIMDTLRVKLAEGFQISEVCVVHLVAGQTDEPRVLTRSLLQPSLMPRVSPQHDVVACLKLDEKEETASLEVIPLDGTPGVTVSQNASLAFAWTPDGSSLVFTTPIGLKDEKLQSLQRLKVLQDTGVPMKPRQQLQADGTTLTVNAPETLGEPLPLATAIMLPRPNLQVLPDGRVLFASQPATLPAPGAGPELAPQLYLISVDGKSINAIPTLSGDLPTDLGFFAASPDGKQVAVVESETDAVAVVDIATGKTEIVSPPHPRWQCETMPAWKSSSELTLAALQGSPPRPQWVLWTREEGVRSIGGKWPATASAEWLSEKEEKKPNQN